MLAAVWKRCWAVLVLRSRQTKSKQLSVNCRAKFLSSFKVLSSWLLFHLMLLLLLLLQWLLHICLKSKMLVWARGRPVKQKCVKRKGKVWSTLLSHSFNCKCVNVDIVDNPLPPRPPPITQSCTAVFCIILCKVAPEISVIVPENQVDWCCFSLCLTGDEIEPADGDIYETYRILFDITFFFFVIVILLAIIQGESVLWSKPGRSWQTGCVGECWSLILFLILFWKWWKIKTTTKDANACRLDALKTAEVCFFF